MLQFLSRRSIKQKLMVILMITSTVALLLASGVFVVYERYQFRKTLVEDVATLARIIGDQSIPAFEFDRPEEAAEMLKALRARLHVVSAALLHQDGGVFAVYHREPGLPPVRTPGLPPSGHRFHENHLELLQPIVSAQPLMLNDRFIEAGVGIGSVFIRYDLAEMRVRLVQYIQIVVIVLVLSSAAAFLLSSKLQQVISRPILYLAATTRQISAERNYGIRATRQTEDELGEFTDAFNQMLGQIQLQDAALQKARDDLERRVEERTRELQEEIEERKETEKKLKSLTRQLQRSNQELQNFASVASHDLQEPLRKVQAFGDRLKSHSEGRLDSEGLDYLQRMQAAARRMQTLIHDLLTYSRISTQGEPFRPVDLNQVVQEVLSDLELLLQRTQGEVKIGSLPLLETAPLQMRQLFQNLISNALKFHRPGVPPVVEISGETPEAGALPGSIPACLITVRDNGIGFDEKYLDRIFNLFQRLHGRSAYEGTGIGLAVCRKIVERHGGAITARSAPNQGATFFITLPLHKTQQD